MDTTCVGEAERRSCVSNGGTYDFPAWPAARGTLATGATEALPDKPCAISTKGESEPRLPVLAPSTKVARGSNAGAGEGVGVTVTGAPGTGGVGDPSIIDPGGTKSTVSSTIGEDPTDGALTGCFPPTGCTATCSVPNFDGKDPFCGPNC